MADLSKYIPCKVVCVESVDEIMKRFSCRHGLFAVVWGGGNRMIEDMCRTRRAMELLDDYATGLVTVDNEDKKILRQHRLIP